MRIRDGGSPDDRAFEQLVREHQSAVLRFCLRQTQDPAAADDACAAVFYEAWRQRQHVDLQGRPARPWLIGVAVNVLRNERRADRRRAAAVERLPRPETPFESAEETVSRLDAAGAAGLLDGLTPQERRVVELCVIEQAPYAVAADRLGLPVGTVRSRLSRAKARMRDEAGQRKLHRHPIKRCAMSQATGVARGEALELLATRLLPDALLVTRLIGRRADVGPTEAGILSALAAGPQRITALATSQALAQPTVTQVVARLGERGWIARDRDPQDGRVVLVSLTDGGHETLAALRDTHRHALRTALSGRSDDEVAALTAAAEALADLTEALRP